MILFFAVIGWCFIAGLGIVVSCAHLDEQEARIKCNNMLRSLGLNEIYSLKEI